MMTPTAHNAALAEAIENERWRLRRQIQECTKIIEHTQIELETEILSPADARYFRADLRDLKRTRSAAEVLLKNLTAPFRLSRG